MEKKDLELFKVSLNSSKIKNLDLPVSAPFHSSLMSKATSIMKNEINKLNFVNLKINLSLMLQLKKLMIRKN